MAYSYDSRLSDGADSLVLKFKEDKDLAFKIQQVLDRYTTKSLETCVPVIKNKLSELGLDKDQIYSILITMIEGCGYELAC